jgi:hypothetical protein
MSCTLIKTIYDLIEKSYNFIILRKTEGRKGKREGGTESGIRKNLHITLASRLDHPPGGIEYMLVFRKENYCVTLSSFFNLGGPASKPLMLTKE